jgi:predicted patatin/cPLA2 family phospholipase
MRHFLLSCAILVAFTSSGQQTFTKPGNKILVISGGGARGAWGVGVVTSLYKKSGGYKAVFGTSTGSLMASYILLQEFDTLADAYSRVNQDSIFNVNPFNVHYDNVKDSVYTTLKTFKILLRVLFGKNTMGETKPLLDLIHRYLTPAKFALLLEHYKNDDMRMTVTVTNMRTGEVKMKSDSGYFNTPESYKDFCNWIWASANEPIFMSYYTVGGADYVDGGVREVIPVQNALYYAIEHNIDSVDVVINNSLVPINQDWHAANGGLIYGLQRLLGVYDLGTVVYNENYAELMNLYYTCAQKAPREGPNPNLVSDSNSKKSIHLRFICIPLELAQRYADELGFVPKPMQELINAGLQFGLNPQPCFEGELDRSSIRKMQKIQ